MNVHFFLLGAGWETSISGRIYFRTFIGHFDVGIILKCIIEGVFLHIPCTRTVPALTNSRTGRLRK